jgi:thiamine-phosphate pyrophosphorylase
MKLQTEHLKLYAVTDRSWLGGRTLAQQVEESLAGGATMVQLREKGADRETLRREALEIRAVCRRYGVPFLINDAADLAAEVEADGVHVGQQDMSPRQARAILGPDGIVGVSAHTVEEARAAQAAGADYLGVGAVFATGTKGNTTPVDYETLKAICAAVDIPVVAIGGVGRDNLSSLAGSGICGVAVVSALYAQPDVRAAARCLRSQVEEMLRG